MPEPRNHRPRRPYRLDRRLDGIAETRRRITAAAFELHATIGPMNTTIRAIAERAGVQRHTVYHHFPDLGALYEACTVHGMESTGMPDPIDWRPVADPVERLDLALGELVAYYRANAAMLANVLYAIDPTEPAPTTPDPWELRMRAIEATLIDPFPASPDSAHRRRLAAVIAHAVAFSSWQSLATGGATGDGLTDTEIRAVLRDLVVGVASRDD